MVNEQHTVIVTAGAAAGMQHTRPVVARVVRGDEEDWREAPIMVYCPEALIHGELELAGDAATPYVQQHK